MNELFNASVTIDDLTMEYCSNDVVYVHGDSSFSLKAVLGSTVFRIDDEYGVSIRTETVDFIVRSESITRNNFLPERGDIIKFNNADYEVLQPNNEPCYRYTDQFCLSMRIHTKKIE